MLQLISKHKAPAIIIACSIALSGAITYGLLAQEKPKSAANVVDIAIADSDYIEGTLDALLRSYVIDQACYDNQNKVYFYRVPDHDHVDGVIDQGWYLVPNTKFLKLQNNTYVVTHTSHEVQTIPDTTGLQCKSQLSDLTWFRDRK